MNTVSRFQNPPYLAPHPPFLTSALQKTPLDPPKPNLSTTTQTFITMQITLLALLTLFTTTGLASRALDPRAVAKTHLYVCTEKAWAGRCKNVEVTVGKCVNMGKAFDKNVSSAGPDDGTFCTLYS